MIHHVVCFKLKDPTQFPAWRELSASLAEIETVRRFKAAPLLKRDRYDCALSMEFDDEKGLQYYQQHPIHQRYLDQVPRWVEEKLVVDLAV